MRNFDNKKYNFDIKKILKYVLVTFLIFFWAFTGACIDSEAWVLFLSLHVVSFAALFFMAYKSGYVS